LEAIMLLGISLTPIVRVEATVILPFPSTVRTGMVPVVLPYCAAVTPEFVSVITPVFAKVASPERAMAVAAFELFPTKIFAEVRLVLNLLLNVLQSVPVRNPAVDEVAAGIEMVFVVVLA